MKESLLSILACPSCRGELRISEAKLVEGEIEEGKLKCSSCGRTYPVSGRIPRFVPKAHYRLFRETWRNFGFSWRRFARIYSDPRDFLDWIKPVRPDFFLGKRVLDAGCGQGMHARFAAEFGARQVVAFDLSPAVEVARQNVEGYPEVHVVQADIYYLPFRPGFDYVYCIGVLQHLPDPLKAFLNLAYLLDEGGCLSIWVYGYEGTEVVRYLVDPVRRVTSRLPLPLIYAGTLWPTAMIYILSRIIAGVGNRKVNEMTGRLLRKIPLAAYLSYMAQFNFTYLHNSIFDQLIAPITRYFRKEEVEAWFRSAGMKEVNVISRNEMSWRGFGRK